MLMVTHRNNVPLIFCTLFTSIYLLSTVKQVRVYICQMFYHYFFYYACLCTVLIKMNICFSLAMLININSVDLISEKIDIKIK